MRLMIVAILAAVAFGHAAEAHAQNDWQYPDPYFGILEIEKSRSAPSERRYRNEIRPPQRGSLSARRARWSTTRPRGGSQQPRAASP